jgi:hypothetical protein
MILIITSSNTSEGLLLSQQTLQTISNFSYMASIYVGSNAQNLSVIYDTGSDYLVVEDL